MTRIISNPENIRPILGAIRSAPLPIKPSKPPPPPPAAPFITISRQPGAGAWTLARHLVDAINSRGIDQHPWSCWDRELIEKVAADLNLSAKLIESLEDRGASWLGCFLESLSFNDQRPAVDEPKVYNRIMATIRSLAQAGRAVIVGCGGVFVTRKMPGGIHIRLIAPFEDRVAFMAREYHLTPDKAAARVKELERNRQAFFKRYWPDEVLGAENFTLTINTAAVDMSTMVEMLIALVRCRIAAIKQASSGAG